MIQSFLDPIRALNSADVDYVVVGGVAVALHGHPRATGDVDMVIALDKVNTAKAVEALLSIGLQPRAPVDPFLLGDDESREDWIANKGLTVFSFANPNNPFSNVDIFVQHPIPYDEIVDGAEVKTVQGVPIRVCSLKTLIRLKKLAGRPIDLEDIQTLEDANGA